MAQKKGGLGKGLDLIFAENTSENAGTTLRLTEIEPNRSQPRKGFDDEALQELADSISTHGLLQPILVRPIFSGGYQIVAGERRWRACRMAGLTEVPVVIREMDDSEFMQLALIENLQREDLNPLEEAGGYQQLMDIHGLSQEQVAKTVGRSRPAVANALRLLNLPENLRVLVEQGQLSAGHARTLLGFQNPQAMEDAAKRVVAEGLSVRELEKLQKRMNTQVEVVQKPQKPREHYYQEAELALNTYLGRKVKVGGAGKKGLLQIEFYGEEDLKTLLTQMKLDQE